MSFVEDFWPPFFLFIVAFSAGLGLLAVAYPRGFILVAKFGGRWIGSASSSTLFDSRINIDQYVLRHSRLFGVLVTISVTFVWLHGVHVLNPFWTPFFLLLILGLAGFMGLSALLEIKQRVVHIESHIAEARMDGLTGLANRRAFDEELNRRLAHLERKSIPFCLLLIDVDHFKSFNDAYGHLAGDTILVKGVSEILSTVTPKMDIVARFGGDEFAVILLSCNLDKASLAAERLRKAVTDHPLSLEESDVQITISLGLAAAEPTDDAASIIGRADKALYASKQAGRNCSYRYNGQTCEPIEPDECSVVGQSDASGG